MLMYPQINPVALQLGPIAIHWYGLTYLAAFALFFFLATRRLRHEPYRSLDSAAAWARKDIEDMLFLGVMGVIVGGRLGYCLFYKPGYYLTHPLEIFFVWQGGMSFHGGMLGVIASMIWYSHSRARPFWQVMDFIAPCVPLGLAAGRVGNFINGELWGREAPADLPWAMGFPNAPGGILLLRHPSQLYEAALEGLVLLTIMAVCCSRHSIRARFGMLCGIFLTGYGVARIIGEHFREPDAFLGFLAGGITMGQVLSLPMILLGLVLIVRARSQPAYRIA